MLLSACEIGSKHPIENIILNDSLKRRFEILGMTKDAQIEVLNSKKNGAIIVKVRGTRFAIGKRFADGIVVGDR